MMCIRLSPYRKETDVPWLGSVFGLGRDRDNALIANREKLLGRSDLLAKHGELSHRILKLKVSCRENSVRQYIHTNTPEKPVAREWKIIPKRQFRGFRMTTVFQHRNRSANGLSVGSQH
jgi:hypothetical protein